MAVPATAVRIAVMSKLRMWLPRWMGIVANMLPELVVVNSQKVEDSTIPGYFHRSYARMEIAP
jgi:hypothetical protein